MQGVPGKTCLWPPCSLLSFATSASCCALCWIRPEQAAAGVLERPVPCGSSSSSRGSLGTTLQLQLARCCQTPANETYMQIDKGYIKYSLFICFKCSFPVSVKFPQTLTDNLLLSISLLFYLDLRKADSRLSCKCFPRGNDSCTDSPPLLNHIAKGETELL